MLISQNKKISPHTFCISVISFFFCGIFSRGRQTLCLLLTPAHPCSLYMCGHMLMLYRCAYTLYVLHKVVKIWKNARLIFFYSPVLLGNVYHLLSSFDEISDLRRRMAFSGFLKCLLNVVCSKKTQQQVTITKDSFVFQWKQSRLLGWDSNWVHFSLIWAPFLILFC